MAIIVYLKVVQGKLSLLSSRPVLALYHARGSAFNCYRSLSDMQEPTEKMCMVQPYDSNKPENNFRHLMKEKWRTLGKLKRTTEEKEVIIRSFIDLPMFDDVKHEKKKYLNSSRKDQYANSQKEASITEQIKSLGKEEEKLVDILESTAKETQKLRFEFLNEQIKLDEIGRGCEDDPLTIDFFHMREGTQYFDLIDYLFKNCKSMKYDDLLEDVLVTFGDELVEKFPFLSDGLMRRGVSFYLVSLRFLHRSQVCHEFGLWLPSSNIDVNQINDFETLSLTWEHFCAAMNLSEQVMLKSDIEKDFNCHEVLDILEIYKKYKELNKGGDDNELQCRYKEQLTEHLETRKKEIMQVTNDIGYSIYSFVFQTWKQGYRMDIHGDPEAEMLKMLNFFNERCSKNGGKKIW